VREALVSLVDAHRDEQNRRDESPDGVVRFESHVGGDYRKLVKVADK
jgi:hypothetical protein